MLLTFEFITYCYLEKYIKMQNSYCKKRLNRFRTLLDAKAYCSLYRDCAGIGMEYDMQSRHYYYACSYPFIVAANKSSSWKKNEVELVYKKKNNLGNSLYLLNQ